MSVIYTPLRQCVTISVFPSVFDVGERKGYFSVSRDRKKIAYGAPAVTGDFTRPEEQMRAEYYVFLLDVCRYPLERIILDMELPLEDRLRFPNIVVFRDKAKKSPYIIAEFKPVEIAGAERESELKRTVYNARILGAPYALCFFGTEPHSVHVPSWEDEYPHGAEISGIPYV